MEHGAWGIQLAAGRRQKTEIGGQKSEVRGQKSEVGGVHCQKIEIMLWERLSSRDLAVS